uniref:G_PROTEIN_RECEP_F1_2 domain-containing protein n=1 Tax=Haemonchus placei TaxID=6290 RepID=A0A0N4WVD0_HAEPC
LSRREVVPFPLIHTIGVAKRHHYNIADINSQTISGERNSTVEELLKNAFYPNAAPVPIGKMSRISIPLRAVSPAIVVRGVEHIRSPSVAVQLVEIRKVKRVGGGYPYGPRNMSIVEFPHPLKVDKYLGSSVAFVTGSYSQRNRSIIDQRTDVWSIKLAVITERWIANFYRISYESCFRKLGPVLIAAAILTTVCILLITYYGERFNGPHLNGRWFSVKDIVRTNMVLMSLLIMNFIGLILTLALRYFGPKRKIGMSLSSKLQANENTTVSNFLFWISVFQFAMLFLSEAALLYLRIYQSSNPLVTAYKENADVTITGFILWIIYHGETFDLPHLNGRWMSIRDVVRTNIVLMSLLIVNFIGLVLTVALHYLSPKRRISMSLSTKFQAMENSIVSNYLFMISSCQFTALFLSQALILYLRIYESENPLVTVYKENADLFNYYTLALPVLSMLYIRKVKNKRNMDIRNHISIKTIGTVGWANYSAVIEKQWN